MYRPRGCSYTYSTLYHREAQKKLQVPMIKVQHRQKSKGGTKFWSIPCSYADFILSNGDVLRCDRICTANFTRKGMKRTTSNCILLTQNDRHINTVPRPAVCSVMVVILRDIGLQQVEERLWALTGVLGGRGFDLDVGLGGF